MPGNDVKTSEEPQETVESDDNSVAFDQLGLDPDVLKAVTEAGYTQPTPIQAQAIPEALKGRDVLGIAQTGTGKTASFTLPMIHKLARGRARARMPRSLILEPTRELAAQVAENFETYGKYHKLSMALLIGGVSFGDQERKLDRGVDVLIATPGRLLDHCGRGKVLLTGVQTLVIDEADRMLDMGFIPDIEDICKRLPRTRQTLFFSATMPPEIQRLTETFLKDPVRIEVARAASTASTVEQRLVRCTREDKRDTLRKIIESQTIKNAIIFCNRKRDVSVLERSLKKHGFSVGALHGDLDQHVRTRTLDGFRNNEITLLVASDVAARGLDIPDVSHVFNFDVPTHAEDYVHRIGRTGRAGREGHTFMLATKADGKYVDAIEKLIGRSIDVDNTFAGQGRAEEEAEPATKGRRQRGRRSPRAATEKTATEQADTQKSVTAEASTGAPEKAPRQPSSRRKPSEGDTDNRRREKPSRGGRGRKNNDDGPSPVGMGDHVPAFITRPVKIAKKGPQQSEDA